MDFEKTLNEATDSVVLNPKVDLFKSIALSMNSRPSAPKEHITVIKKRLRCKHPRSQLLTLELIEYLTCVCNQNVHNVFHDKEFLTQINNMLNGVASDEIRQKVLHLLQFWGDYFKSDQDLFPNFTKMYMRGVQSGIKFPPPAKSQYANFEKVESGGAQSGSLGQRGGIWDNSDQGQHNGGSQYSNPQSNQSKQKSPAILKVEHDLDVFVESIQEAENRLRKGDMSRDTQELVRNLQEMGPKIHDLGIKLKTAGEYETAEKALSSGSKLSAFLDNYNRFQRSGPQGFGQQSSNQGIQQAPKAQGGFFEDFNTTGGQGHGGQPVSFDNFNQFGQTPTQPPQQKMNSSGGFWEETGAGASGNQGSFPQPTPPKTSSGGFFETQFNDGHKTGNSSIQGGQNNRSAGQGFFDDHFGGGNQGSSASQQKKIDEVNLLGVDTNAASRGQSGPQRQGMQGGSNPANIDLLSLGTNPQANPQPPQQNMNQNNPFGGQQQMGGFGVAPQQQGAFQYHQGMAGQMHMAPFGHPQQIGSPPAQNFPPQNQGINPLMYQHMMVNHQPLSYGAPTQTTQPGYGGVNTGNSFGASNNVAFTSDVFKGSSDKRNDPFSDLTTDLV